MPVVDHLQMDDKLPEPQHLVYISSHATAEQDLIDSLICRLFKLNSESLIWGDTDMLNQYTLYVEERPVCIIISPPFGRTSDKEDPQEEAVWLEMRERFPDIPVIWLAPDSADIPDFLPVDDPRVRIVETEHVHSDMILDFTIAIAELTGIKANW